MAQRLLDILAADFCIKGRIIFSDIKALLGEHDLIEKRHICTKRIFRKLVALVLMVTFCITFASDNLTIKSNAEVTEESIKEKENQIDDAKKERDKMKSSLTDIEAVKKELEQDKSDINSYIAELDASLTDIQSNIDALEQQISDKEAEIEETKAELEEAKAQQQQQYESMKERIRFMYEKGDTYLLELLLESDSYGDMLNKAEYITELSAYDNKKLQEYILTTQLIALTQEALEEEQATLEEAKADVEAEQASMEALMSEKQSQLSVVNASISEKEAAIKEYEAQIAEENETIAALEKAVEADKAKLASQNKRTYDGGMFTWPCPAYTRISDDYGMRMHPTLGIEKMHNGIDLAAPTGSSILAAYAGTVVAASYSSTMGNYVMIDHGDGLYTIYMHASALYVSTGQEVTAGQNIAAVGSTGRSTGPHLHFGVRLNGSYVSPWNYLK